ncbi:MAG: MerR family transcriptional regulator [Halobacteria archaeon]|nr:MerR family transcriptional regulator [Halobacteria archaeon]
MSAQQHSEGLYPIGTVSEITGVNAVTLRAWERRYGLIQPERTPKGHRMYSQTDVDKIQLILEQLGQGIAISRVADSLITPELSKSAEADTWQQYQARMVEAISRFDENVLDSIYNEAMSLYPVDIVTRQLLTPLLINLGERWLTTEGSVAEEHFFSVFMRNKLGARFHHRNMRNTGPCLIAACLPGEHHEFGLLLFALAAHARGYRLILLGADMPLAELPHVIQRTRSDGVVLSGSVLSDASSFKTELQNLAKAGSIPVFIGGHVAEDYSDVIDAAGAKPLPTDLFATLRAISSVLPITRKVNS